MSQHDQEDDPMPLAPPRDIMTAGIQETIVVPDRDLSPSEMARIMRQVARVTNFLSSQIMRAAALDTSDRCAGAGHPICQSILACASQADAAAISLLGPSQIMRSSEAPIPVPVRRH